MPFVETFGYFQVHWDSYKREKQAAVQYFYGQSQKYVHIFSSWLFIS